MNFEEWYIKYRQSQGMNCKLEMSDVKNSWESCKQEIIKLLEQNKELEAISYDGKKVYKIYGNAIEKINESI